MSLESEIIIEARGLGYQIGDHEILKGITFAVRRGEYVGIVGPNGAGKTTLVKILLGLLQPTAGTLEMFGKPFQRSNALEKIGYVPQRAVESSNVFPTTVQEVAMSGRLFRKKLFHSFTKNDQEAVDRALEVAGVADLKNRPLGALSGGQRQRVAIARAIARNPEILILDEPTVGVDIGHQETFYAFLRNLRETLGITILFITHDLDFVAKEVECVLCINQRLICHQHPRDFFTEENLQKVYGKNIRFIPHHH